MRCLREQIPEREPALGLRQVDTFAGYNVMILLFELHRYGQSKDELKDQLIFYPCGQPDTAEFDRDRLYRIIGYGECLGVVGFSEFVAPYLSSANLSSANLHIAYLSNANLSSANLSRVNLSNANLTNADLKAVSWDRRTEWANAEGLHEARNVPVELAQRPEFAAAVALSRGISYAEAAKIPEAIAAYQEAQIIDSEIEIPAVAWNLLCWMGSLHGYAVDVLFAGEKAVSLSSPFDNYQESRGLARAIMGNLEGAAADFQASLDSFQGAWFSPERRERRERWLAALRVGENPFTPEELEFLRQNSDA